MDFKTKILTYIISILAGGLAGSLMTSRCSSNTSVLSSIARITDTITITKQLPPVPVFSGEKASRIIQYGQKSDSSKATINLALIDSAFSHLREDSVAVVARDTMRSADGVVVPIAFDLIKFRFEPTTIVLPPQQEKIITKYLFTSPELRWYETQEFGFAAGVITGISAVLIYQGAKR